MFEKTTRAAGMGVAGIGQGIPYGAEKYAGPEMARDCAPSFTTQATSPEAGRITGAVRSLELRIEETDKLVAVLEHRLEVFRRPFPTGIREGNETDVPPGSIFGNGLGNFADRLALINARLNELAQSIDL